MGHESAEELKAQGNKYFHERHFKEAIESYTKAINKDNRVATYYTNRSLCYMNLNRWREAIIDCQKAIEIDKNSVKGYYVLGRSQMQLGNYDDAIKHLAKAIDLSQQYKDSKVSFGDEIHAQLRSARRQKFKVEEEKRIQQEVGLVQYLERLIDEDLTRKFDTVLAEDKSITEQEQNKMIQEAESYKKELSNLLAKADERRRKREIPDYLCGKISFELMRDPVITPSGITYDRADIKQHLQRVGHFDPVTRAPLKEDCLIPNLAMKEVIESFLAENEWAEFDEPGGF